MGLLHRQTVSADRHAPGRCAEQEQVNRQKRWSFDSRYYAAGPLRPAAPMWNQTTPREVLFNMKEQKKKAWLYCRIDAPEDTHGRMKAQKRELLNYAEQMGFEVIGGSEDTGGGLSIERPGLTECLRAAELGKMDVLLAQSLSRLSRDTVDALAFLRELSRAGAVFCSPLEGTCFYLRQAQKQVDQDPDEELEGTR
ncbi:MAG: recombinase family protein [Ethanoligenens sp.]